ncbi:MAG: ABC transporter ATP-binding protein [Alphaproteobacteria bacterium]|nr:ABC transporter ATP-binding protein [Alphaproteobacteria bacterium]
MTALLDVSGVSRSFRGLRAVNEVSFAVAPGEIVAVIGPNGAGKTTLFNLIAGALTPDDGAIRFDGRDIAGLRADRRCRLGVARTFQLVRPFAGLTVEDNAIVGALARTPDVAAARREALAALDRLGLADRRGLLASQLTLPDRKRLEMARALATGPRLLLLDEAMAGLRPTEIDGMVSVLARLNRETGLTIVLIEHVMRAVMALAQRIVVLHHGEKIAEGTPADISRDPVVIRSYFGEAAA